MIGVQRLTIDLQIRSQNQLEIVKKNNDRL